MFTTVLFTMIILVPLIPPCQNSEDSDFPLNSKTKKRPANRTANTQTFLAGALYREFREFMRILTTFLGKTHRNPSQFGSSVVAVAIFAASRRIKAILNQKYPQYCWEFHDNSSERPSPEPLLPKRSVPAVLGGREFWKCSGAFKCLELEGLGDPSHTLEGNSRKRSESVSGVFPEFLPESPSRTGGMAPKRGSLP